VKVVSRDAWLSARRELLAKEKEWSLKQDALRAERRKLSMVTIEKEYVFPGAGVTVSSPRNDATVVRLAVGGMEFGMTEMFSALQKPNVLVNGGPAKTARPERRS
jgi:hypothetical protein